MPMPQGLNLSLLCLHLVYLVALLNVTAMLSIAV